METPVWGEKHTALRHSVRGWRVENNTTPRTNQIDQTNQIDHIIDYITFPLHHLDISRQVYSRSCRYDLDYYVAEWDPNNPHDLWSTCFLRWICTMQLLRNPSQKARWGTRSSTVDRSVDHHLMRCEKHSVEQRQPPIPVCVALLFPSVLLKLASGCMCDYCTNHVSCTSCAAMANPAPGKQCIGDMPSVRGTPSDGIWRVYDGNIGDNGRVVLSRCIPAWMWRILVLLTITGGHSK